MVMAEIRFRCLRLKGGNCYNLRVVSGMPGGGKCVGGEWRAVRASRQGRRLDRPKGIL